MNRPRPGLPALLILSFSVSGISFSAQNKPARTGDSSSSVTIRANVQQVLVPVVVTDKKGHNVTDLKVSDFRIFEDGTPERIVAFSAAPDSMVLRADGTTATHIESEVMPGLEQNTNSDPPRRTYLICVDTSHSRFANFAHIREALRKFFEQEKSSNSQYALIALGRQTQVIQDSTRDPATILASIASKNFMKTMNETESANMAKDVQQFTYFMRDFYCTHCACEAFNTRDSPSCPDAQARLQGYLLRSGERTRILDENFYHALQQIVAGIGSMPTARTVVFISDGVNRFPGRELYGVMSGFAPKDHRFEFNPRDTQDSLDAIVRLAVRNDVRFYTIDSRGLYTVASLGGSTFDASTGGGAGIPQSVDRNEMIVARENTDALSELARETGGLFFENNNDLLKGIRKAFADGREHYVLAYVPSNKKLDGTYRKILVEVKDRRLQVHAKPGYWATKD